MAAIDPATGMSTSDGKAKPPWYTEQITSIPENSRQLLEQYSHIPPDQVIPYVQELVGCIPFPTDFFYQAKSTYTPPIKRDRAFNIFPYPCIGQLRFLSLNLAAQPGYGNVVKRLKGGEKLLDVGCCFGQDIRKLVVDGVPAENVYGLDVERGFVDLGYELFRDRKTLTSKFIVADVSDPRSHLGELEGKMDVLYLSSFLHLWNWKDQVKVLRRLVSLGEDRKGTLFLGRQLGTTVSGEFPLQGPNQLTFRHNVESFDRLWKQVGQETGTRWHVEASLYMAPEVSGNRGQSWADPNMRMLQFSVVRE